MVEPSIVEQKIREGVGQVTHLEIEDLTGTKDHYRAVIVSAAFEGQTRVQRHRAVYEALGDLMAGPVHALTLATHTPESWADRTE